MIKIWLIFGLFLVHICGRKFGQKCCHFGRKFGQEYGHLGQKVYVIQSSSYYESIMGSASLLTPAMMRVAYFQLVSGVVHKWHLFDQNSMGLFLQPH